MTSYVVPLLAIVALCAGWAVFQLWLARHDPEQKKRSLKCGACKRKDECADPQRR
ncbi:MAG TPA: hypothetical protein VK854_15010 [Woeseiaceae bacterium]|nr:hypothetical protein [Woeseiaceae bacterium]